MIEGRFNDNSWDVVKKDNGFFEIKIDDDLAEVLEGMKESECDTLNDVLKRILKEQE